MAGTDPVAAHAQQLGASAWGRGPAPMQLRRVHLVALRSCAYLFELSLDASPSRCRSMHRVLDAVLADAQAWVLRRCCR